MAQPIRHPRRAFTLMEVMVAIGVFAIGFVAVAAVFPVAAILQRNAVRDAMVQQVGRNADAIINVKLPKVSIGTTLNQSSATWSDLKVHPVEEGSGATLSSVFPLGDRGYPTALSDPTLRNYFWVPLVRYSDNGTDQAWEIHYFLLAKGPNETGWSKGSGTWANPDDTSTAIPGVVKVSASRGSGIDEFVGVNSGGDLRVGDWVLDSNGTSYQITQITSPTSFKVNTPILDKFEKGSDPGAPTAIWYAPPSAAGQLSPARRIRSTTVLITGSPTLDVISGISYTGGTGADQNSNYKELVNTEGVLLTYKDIRSSGWSRGLTSPFTPGAGYGTFVQASTSATSTGRYFTWKIIGLSPGTYKVWAKWPPNATYSDTSVPYTLADPAGSSASYTANLNQQAAPDDDTADGVSWETISGAYTITGNTLTVTILDTSMTGYIIADAIRIQR
ncbi:MAG: prepilin-type N-terminal cleavage/methylation domain-containing protein [Phycisphaera sp.]|nr:prepilin-type N-terminal cleavage/methylation domain-containing protein [Phycisphaera sp.]